MYIAILNWRDGENDPFTLFSQCLKNWFERMGRPAVLVNLDHQTQQTMTTLAPNISFAFTWQGLGEGIGRSTDKHSNIWDDLEIPLICFHGDHACHMPANHNASSNYVRHIYACASFSNFANQYIPRTKAATYQQGAVLFENQVHHQFSGDYFVFPKNLDDTSKTLDSWKNADKKYLGNILCSGHEAIAHELTKNKQKNHHAVVDELLTPEVLSELSRELGADSELLIRFHVHALLDKSYRNIISEHVINELKDVPLKIYGRGWDRFKTAGNSKHEYLDFDKVTDNAFQFSSNYGILDASPIHDNLHDRTMRSMGNHASFLSGSDWPHDEFFGKNYNTLFFNTKPGLLREQVERVISAPETHRSICNEFRNDYHRHFSPYGFLKALETVANSMAAPKE
jgi:hypothetical protein